MIWLAVIILVVSLFLLVKSSDFFVESVAKIAKLFGVSDFVIGMSIVALGTSLPELVTAIIAVISGSPEIVIGAVVGSNIANIGMIAGLAAFVCTLSLKKRIYKEDASILVFVTVLFYIFAFDGKIGGVESFILVCLFIIYLVYLFKFQPVDLQKEKELIKKRFMLPRFNRATFKELAIATVSLIVLIYAAKYVVSSATDLAVFLGVPLDVIAVTMIALGTSLPELAVSISSLRKGLKDMLIGNIIGSNIMNILLICGVSGLIGPLSITRNALLFMFPAMLIITSMLMLFMRSDQKLVKSEGVALLVFYVLFVFLVYII